ncbi:MAG: bifunctional phosphopantothenoylcysteine decarboxylase/phosphopantothenate--cysteine ligase CoaBC [Firmicutes bacterium]|nr:bifunctional phosphopantothenoylcysteine decarboxylase/phosphopantothenate--cysteine ligase CoaBC [Bacillota bacterium]
MKQNVVLGVTGGIACYKAAEIVSRLAKQDINVDVIMTENACRFVGPATFQTLSKNPVVTDTFASPKYWEVEHIALSKKADVFLIAPATADIIGKIASGIADDMLSTTVMAVAPEKVVLAPAMNVNMYNNPIVQGNIEKLRGLGYRFIEPGEGLLACGDTGRGRMAEPAEIEAYVMNLLGNSAAAGPAAGEDGGTADPVGDFAGKRILVTAGPTVEDIDPVRYISNRSSGKMGFAIAEAARRRGAQVTLVAGPVQLTCHEDIRRLNVRSTKDMLAACESVYDDVDIVIKAAAPADFYVVNGSEHKIKKQDGKAMQLELAENPDIIATLGKKKGNRILVGFAAETRNLEEYAKAKMERKNLDMIVANNVAQEGAGFDRDTNIVTIIKRSGEMERFEQMKKTDVADLILDQILLLKK